MRRRMLMEQRGLPSEYQEVEWIGKIGSGSNYKAYIDCQLDLTGASFKMEAEITVQSVNNRGALLWLFQGFKGYSNYRLSTYEWINYTNSTGNVNPSIIFSQKQHFVFDYNYSTDTVVQTVDNITGTFTPTGSEGIKTIIFNTTEFSTYAYIHSYQIEVNGGLVRNLIPCYRKSDGEIGMYDLVTKTFFTNAGSGTFIKGADVN